jgi:hypothetical protein
MSFVMPFTVQPRRTRRSRRILFFVFVASFVVMFLLPDVASAQSKVPPAFLGTWASLGMNPTASPMGAPPTELPYAEIDKKLGDFVQPWALAQHEALEWNIDDTGQVCKPDGIFRQGHGTGAGNFRFVETPTKLYQVWGVDERGLQRIYLYSPHPRNVPLTWNGDSRGRFEGNETLIVDTIGFNDKSWLSSDRWVHSEELRVIERYRLFGDGAYIQLRVFIDDRKALKAPYTYTRYYRKVAESNQGGESVCNENLPEEDLWSIRRNKLLADHEAQLRAFMAKYDNEPLPRGSDPAATPVQTAAAATSAADAAKLRGLGGIYEAVPAGAALPGGLKGAGVLSDIALLPASVQTATSRNLEFDPAKHCLVIGPFRMMAREGTKIELLPTASRLTMLFENIANGNKREIHLGRTRHPDKLEPSYLGDSIGRWDGDTFVVDTVGFNDFTWLNDAGAPHSDALHLIERIKPVQSGRFLEYQVTAEDPKALARPYSYTRYYQKVTTELQEDFCEDNVR